MPYEKLPAIATREEFVLDLNAATWSEQTPDSDVEQYLSENVAAHSAVVLAKTQTSAARLETQQAIKENQRLKGQLREKEQENLSAEKYIDELQTYIEQLERYQTELLDRFDQTRDQLKREKASYADLASQNQTLQLDRDDLLVSMDWVSRRRYQRRQQGREQFQQTLTNQVPPNVVEQTVY